MSNKVDDLIKQILKEWLEWVESGADSSHIVFSRSVGLCGIIFDYCRMYRELLSGLEPRTDFEEHTPNSVEVCFHWILRARCGQALTPFNTLDVKYWDEKCAESMHLNPRRIAFVRSFINE